MTCTECRSEPTHGEWPVCLGCGNNIAIDAFQNVEAAGLTKEVFTSPRIVNIFRQAVRDRAANRR
jgi:hypothetical protein